MVGFNSSDALFDTLEETGGSKDAVVVSHTHTATTTATDSGHTHSVPLIQQVGTFGSQLHGAWNGGSTTTTTGFANISASTTVASTGSSGTNANLQPYITVRMWKRTA